MFSRKPKLPMTDAELKAWEATRDIEAELLTSAGQAIAGLTSVSYSPVITTEKAVALSQPHLAVVSDRSEGVKMS